MPSVKLLLKKSQALSDNSHPIIIQVLKDRKKAIITLPFSCKETDWDGKSNLPKNSRLSMLCNKAFVEIQELVYDSLSSGWSAKKILSIYSGKENKKILFFQYYKSISKDLGGGGFSTTQGVDTMVNRFKKFTGGEIPFSDIDYDLLKRYKDSLSDLKSSNRYLQTVRRIYGHAVEHDYFEPTKSPFKSSLFKKRTTTINRNLTLLETKELFKYKIENRRWQRKKSQELALNIWKFCFLMRGMNFVDAILIENEKIKEHFRFTRQKLKTRTEAKLNILVLEETQEIIDKYYDKNEKYLFPVLENDEDINENKKSYARYTYKRNIVNRNMKKIGEELEFDTPLTTMSPRYTFINIAKEIGVPFLYLQELIGHKTMSTTDIYMDAFPQKQLDEYHRKVIDAVIRKS